MSQNGLKEILTKYKTVAVVGLSRDPSKDSYRVAEYLKKNGFNIVPINPFVEKILVEKSYRSLIDMPAEVQKTLEVIDVFRPTQDVPLIVEQAVQLKKIHGKPHVVWMQLGIINEEAAEAARAAGLTVIMDKCIMREHRRLTGDQT